MLLFILINDEILTTYSKNDNNYHPIDTVNKYFKINKKNLIN